MIELMRQRTRRLARRLSLALLLALVAGCLLALAARRQQSLQEMLAYRTRIKANLGAMHENSRLLQQQTAAFRNLLAADDDRQSPELRLFQRIDQIRMQLKPLDLQVTPVETNEGVIGLGFTMRLPLASYAAAVNAMGRLQAEGLPLTVFRSATFSNLPGTEFTLEGAVQLPARQEVRP